MAFSLLCSLLTETSFVSSPIQLADLKLSVDHLEKERDFYFSKLRDVEILCQTPELEDVPVSVSLENVIFFFLSLVSVYFAWFSH